MKTYARGIYFNPVHPDTPDSVKAWKKGSISIHVENLIKYLGEIKHEANEKGYVYHDLTLNEKDGETFYSLPLNTWKPDGAKKNNDPIANHQSNDDLIF